MNTKRELERELTQQKVLASLAAENGWERNEKFESDLPVYKIR